ncbi:tautomerase family protein [Rhodococcus koreensis]|uniref:tautomerase family protein n=1 Tax=Rhodococcus koreensis TaxID=99653 RepID=UPI00366A8CC5
MPLIHLHVIENRRSAEQLKVVADAVHGVMLEHFAAPDRDRYQLITEHKPGHIIAEDTGLGYDRTDDIIVIQITQQGRTLQQKQKMFQALADRLHDKTGLAPTDLIVSVIANDPEDWSFGNGIAHFVEGHL